MRMLNLGCGHHYHQAWTNVDFISTGAGVIGHNLNEGIPFETGSFDVVYHSHVLEHLTRENGMFLLQECFRVLKQGGILRVAVPDLEQIVRLYLEKLEEKTDDDYDWMMIELYDQTVRNLSGGEMSKYLQQPTSNTDFVLGRIGQEGRQIIDSVQRRNQCQEKTKKNSIISRWWNDFKKRFPERLHSEAKAIGIFRLGGEIHQWMYDSFSLERLLKKAGFESVQKTTAFESRIVDFQKYALDGSNGIVRKPDSLFMEALKCVK